MGIATRWTFATRSAPQKHGIGEPNDMWERYQAAMSEEGRERRAGRLRLAAVLLLAALLILTVVAALSGAAVVCSAQQERSWDTDFSGSVSRAEFVAGLASVGVRLEGSVLDAIFDGAERGSGEWSSGLDTIKNLH